jgi:tripartite-type tricarboxylate transporter receptor subunit TctC
MQHYRALALSIVCVVLVAAQCLAADVSSYPLRPIRIIAPLGAGGTGDALARVIGERLASVFGQTVVIDNRPGANGIIGTELVVKATPDGYTLLVASTGNIAVNPSIYGAKLPFNVERDLMPITQIANSTYVAHTSPSFAARSIKELIALAKAAPGSINYASGGVGSTPHLMAVLFENMAGVRMTHVPYKSGPLGRVAVAARESDVMFDGLPTAITLIKAGKLRALGVTSEERSSAAPEIPTIAEAGVPGYSALAWYGLFAPRGTPRDVIARLHEVAARELRTPEMREKMLAQGFESSGNTPEQLAAFIRSEMVKWGKVVKAAGLKPD